MLEGITPRKLREVAGKGGGQRTFSRMHSIFYAPLSKCEAPLVYVLDPKTMSLEGGKGQERLQIYCVQQAEQPCLAALQLFYAD